MHACRFCYVQSAWQTEAMRSTCLRAKWPDPFGSRALPFKQVTKFFIKVEKEPNFCQLNILLAYEVGFDFVAVTFEVPHMLQPQDLFPRA